MILDVVYGATVPRVASAQAATESFAFSIALALVWTMTILAFSSDLFCESVVEIDDSEEESVPLRVEHMTLHDKVNLLARMNERLAQLRVRLAQALPPPVVFAALLRAIAGALQSGVSSTLAARGQRYLDRRVRGYCASSLRVHPIATRGFADNAEPGSRAKRARYD